MDTMWGHQICQSADPSRYPFTSSNEAMLSFQGSCDLQVYKHKVCQLFCPILETPHLYDV